jgi:8-oxo-dGTP pyrophosphatase MutT (NUDIX family)
MMLLKRDGYDFPGGGVEIEETVEEALIREFVEETGIKVKVGVPFHCETQYFHPAHSATKKDQFWD